MTDHPLPPTEPVRCRATKGDGTPCGVSWGLSPAEPVRCRFVRADGSGCRVSFGLCDGWCLVHDPDRKDAARAAAAAGADAVNAARRAAKYRTLDPRQLGGQPARTRQEIERYIAAMNFAEGTGAVDPHTHREYIRGSLAHLKLINDRTLAREVRDLKRQVKAMKRGRSA